MPCVCLDVIFYVYLLEQSHLSLKVMDSETGSSTGKTVKNRCKVYINIFIFFSHVLEVRIADSSTMNTYGKELGKLDTIALYKSQSKNVQPGKWNCVLAFFSGVFYKTKIVLNNNRYHYYVVEKFRNIYFNWKNPRTCVLAEYDSIHG